ncbi:unnamed protein product [Acanthosepion pharaonis]|uniref:Uncharacterized protein n=1 Tax=Acanthosepion pharaonis TaxID=158019 RepID=A0A812BVA6_ACAPH|nr:unnamed protein product [Sepia pharaonis]
MFPFLFTQFRQLTFPFTPAATFPFTQFRQRFPFTQFRQLTHRDFGSSFPFTSLLTFPFSSFGLRPLSLSTFPFIQKTFPFTQFRRLTFPFHSFALPHRSLSLGFKLTDSFVPLSLYVSQFPFPLQFSSLSGLAYVPFYVPFSSFLQFRQPFPFTQFPFLSFGSLRSLSSSSLSAVYGFVFPFTQFRQLRSLYSVLAAYVPF